MQEDFDIDTVLSVVSRYNITDDYSKVINLVSFISGIPNISMTDFFKWYEPARIHILSLYPELDDQKYDFDFLYIKDYVKEKKEQFDEYLTISVYGEKIQKNKLTN